MNRDDRERMFTDEEICEILEKAERMGFSVISRVSDVAHLSVADVERLVSVIQ